MLTVGSLFSGIGGFDLGFERAGMRTVWFCEQDEFCRRVLARHWPGVPCYDDVRALVADAGNDGQAGRTECDSASPTGGRRGEYGGDVDGRADLLGRSPDAGEGRVAAAGTAVPVPVPYVDVLCGGFPCQDISLAGKGAGIDGSRSGLWSEFARIIGELRPRYVVVENVPAITSRGLDRVLSDLAAGGFDAEWDHIPASAVGAPHRRDRFWLVAYPSSDELREQPGRECWSSRTHPALVGLDGEAWDVADAAAGNGWDRGRRQRVRDISPDAIAEGGEARPLLAGGGERSGDCGGEAGPGCAWEFEPNVGRVADGVPARVDRLRALGNSLVPQIAEWIGRRIVEFESR